MPSGAKKRKATAKKKLQNNITTNKFVNGSHSFGSDTSKSHDERVSDSGEGERESSEEPVVNYNAQGKEEVSLGENNAAAFANEEKSGENYNDVPVNVEKVDDVRVTYNGEYKRSSSSSSSSSLEDDDVAVEKEKPVVVVSGEGEQEVSSSDPEASRENPVISEFVSSSVEESIPVEEFVKQVVSLPHESNAENPNEAAESPVISQVIESAMKQNIDEVSLSADENRKAHSGMTDFVEEKIETKVIEVVDEGSLKLSEVVDVTAKDCEGFLPQSSGVTFADSSCGDNLVKKSESCNKYVEEQPLVSSAPLPVRRTSWTNCCGLFEVFSGGARR